MLDRRTGPSIAPAWIVAIGAAVAAGAAGLAVGIPAPAQGWIRAEWSNALDHLVASGQRLAAALVVAAVAALPLAAAMRRWRRVETALTPWLLTALAVPWVLIAIALNMMVHLSLGAEGATWLAAGGGAAWLLGALGPRQQTPGARAARIRRAVWTTVWMLLAAELLTLSQGVGTQVRFYVLYWSLPHLALYGALTLILLALAAGAGRFSAPLLHRAAARLGEGRG